MKFLPTFEWGATLDKPRARCAPSNHGAPWYDFIRYRGDPSAPNQVRYGLVQTAICGIGGRATRTLVVQRLEEATPEAVCVRTRFGFKCLRWAMMASCSVPALEAVDLSSVCRLEQIEPDMAPLTDKYGLFTRPRTPASADEWRERRFFVNSDHTWTSTPLHDL